MSPLPPRNVLSPIKPKERKGEMSRAITLASIKNALEEIGNNDEDSNYEKPATNACNNPFASDIDDDTLKHSPNTKKETGCRAASLGQITLIRKDITIPRPIQQSFGPTVPLPMPRNKGQKMSQLEISKK